MAECTKLCHEPTGKGGDDEDAQSEMNSNISMQRATGYVFSFNSKENVVLFVSNSQSALLFVVAALHVDL